ncbi:uncharacterized protein LOC128314990 [Acinonyx jubatus]|uniref:Uncharacterized protein LOC128314990 n=1 Tax=Acinonyx jubatus TaxID=32536 RepID=A0ABM3PX55_ACIJB|nr:uncharacterized protein LOC128314990 [Acinonyx jubatus]
MLALAASVCGDAPDTAPKRSLLSKRSGRDVDPRGLRGAHLSGRGSPSWGGRSAGRQTVTLRLAWACIASETQVFSGTRSFPGEESLVLHAALGGSLGPAASRASFPAPRPRAQVFPHSLFPRPGSRVPGLRVSSAWARGPAAGPASLPTGPRPASAAQGLGAWPLRLPPTSAPPPPKELLFLVNPPRASTRSAHSSQLAAARTALRAPPAPRAAAAAAARPAHRAALTEPAPPRPPPSRRSPPQAPVAAGKCLLAEQRRSPSQLSIPPSLLPRHSLLRERWLFGEGGEVRGSPTWGEGGRDSLSRSGRRFLLYQSVQDQH